MGAWPLLAASLGGVELVNLGFSGSALRDPFTARTMSTTPADLISVKIGINLVNTDLMRLRAFRPAVHGFLDTIRDGHPDAPLIVVSPIYCGIHEDTPARTPISTTSTASICMARRTSPRSRSRMTCTRMRQHTAGSVSDSPLRY
jgi:hypothetical protein